MLANNVPFLSPARVNRLARGLRARGWWDEAVQTNVLAKRQGGLAAGLPSRIGVAYVERFAPLMNLDEMGALAGALRARGCPAADIRAHLPFADLPGV